MNSSPSRTPRLHQTRAVALIIVLSMLVLLSAMIVAFMSTVSVDRTATQASVSGSVSRQIADNTVNLVIGQIREGTTSKNEATTWVSQPGAIRTYSGKQTTGQISLGKSAYYNVYKESDAQNSQDFVYKLYSADKMRVPTSQYNSKDLDPGENKSEVAVIEKWNPADLDTQATDHVDLNEPMLSKVIGSDGKTFTEPRYPIIDPRAKYGQDESRNLDPKPGIVDGFDAKIQEDKTLKLQGGALVPYVPMPVKWLYVMRDGAIGPASLASEKNPIVGRTAFWTDDETCKLNINTASEGTFWDTPSMSSMQESGNIPAGKPPSSGVLTSATGSSLSLAVSQPVKGEYQRYSGHPATTSLSPVLGWLWGVKHDDLITPEKNNKYFTFKEAIYQITPFLPSGPGTTQGATRNSKLDLAEQQGKLTVATKHLYASVDELIFKRTRNDATGSDPKPLLTDVLTPGALERTRFFLTTNSRAPEVNLFGRPRLTIWPVNADPALRTQFDDAFTFASTIYKDPILSSAEKNDKRFCLLRYDAKDNEKDFTLSGAPGGINTSQNTDMYKYLQWLTGKSSGGTPTQVVPGFGGRFAQKYKFDGSSERDQILTEMFDYVRTVNLVDTGTASNSSKAIIPYTPIFTTYDEKPGDEYKPRLFRSVDWSSQVTPLKIKNTMGLGRFVTISEAALVFYRSGPPITAPAPAKQRSMQAALIFEMATAMPGYPAIRETFFTKVRAIAGRPTGIQFTGGPNEPDIGFSQEWLININNVASHEVADGRGFMPILGAAAPLYCFPEHKGYTNLGKTILPGSENPSTDPNRATTFTAKVKKFANDQSVSRVYKRDVVGDPTLPTAGTICVYPYVSREISLIKAPLTPDVHHAEMTLTGGAFEVEIWSGESPEDPRARKVQTLTLDFPSAPVKVRPPDGIVPNPTAVPPVTGDMRLSSRLDGTVGGSRDLIRTQDVVRSLELTGGMTTASQRGDIRIAAARSVVPSTYYTPSGGFKGLTDLYYSTTPVVHSLACGHGDQMTGAAFGYLVGKPPIAYSRGGKPYILPREVDAGVTRSDGKPGDWDRGLSKHMDGAFGNKVDEGNVAFAYDQVDPLYPERRLPYYRGRAIEETGQSFFTPNRQLPSAVMFGSLPTGALEGRPWQTLLFRPDHDSHPGAALGADSVGAPDHLFLDLFHIPVVEPFAISEPFSTLGKVNMNYVIAPFGYARNGDGKKNPDTNNERSYIRRDTALRGVLKSTFITAVRTDSTNAAHEENPLRFSDPAKHTFRYPIDLNRTLETFETRLKDKANDQRLFRTASEICDIDLYPKGLSVTDWKTFWNSDYAQTGDNQRERPYAHIFPRLTTKSNVYTIHMRCQTIRKAPSNNPEDAKKFDEKKDTIVSEYRGQATIERFIDPNDQSLKDYDVYETTNGRGKVDGYYRYRVINVKQFAPH